MSYMNSAELDLMERCIKQYVNDNDIYGLVSMMTRHIEHAYDQGVRHGIEDVKAAPFLYGMKAMEQ